MIPFSKSTLGKEEITAVKHVIKSGWVVQGPITEEFEKKFAEYVGAKYAVFVDSGTAALMLALAYTKGDLWNDGDLLPVPALTFAATAEAIVNLGGRPAFVDVDDTFCMEDNRWSPHGIAVNFAGVKAKAYQVIVDSAHRIERDDCLTDIEHLWCYSLYATKNMTTVNGGMVATNNKNAYDWMKRARDHGITKGTHERYKEGAWDYDIEFVGWRLKADDLRAAIGLEQLKKLDKMNEKRNKAVSLYNRLLGLNRTGNHLFPIFVNERPKFVDCMARNGIQVSVHYPKPLHKMTAYKKYNKEELPKSEWFCDHCVSLPLFPQLKAKEIEYICEKVKESKLFIYVAGSQI